MSDTSTETAAPSDATGARATSAEDWKARRAHRGITLPSGAVVDIELPNVQKLIKSGVLPNALLEAAIQHTNATKITSDMVSETWDYTTWIIPRMVLHPEITEEDVGDLPAEDVEMLASFAARTADMDAVGHHLAGLETLRTFRDARGLTTLAEALGDA